MHTHVIPRKGRDLDHRGGTDAVYELLDGEEGDVGRVQREFGEVRRQQEEDAKSGGRRTRFPAVDDRERKPRSMEEMEAEAEMLAREMEKEPLD